MLPKISVIILNWNGLKDTIRCLNSLKKITYPNYEVIVVDNGSKGNDADVLEKKYQEYIKLIRNKENLGFAEGNNIAMRQVLKENKSKYVFLLNNDTVVSPVFLTELVKIAQSGEKIGILQPKMLKMDNPKIIDSAGHIFGFASSGIIDRGKGEIDKGQYDDKLDIVGACAGACLYKKEMLENIGLFDKNFFAYYEDAELSWRAHKRGWKAKFVPSSIIYHKRAGSSGKNKKLRYKMSKLCLKNMVLTVKRHGTFYQKILFPLFLLIEVGIKEQRIKIFIKNGFKNFSNHS